MATYNQVANRSAGRRRASQEPRVRIELDQDRRRVSEWLQEHRSKMEQGDWHTILETHDYNWREIADYLESLCPECTSDERKFNLTSAPCSFCYNQ